MRSRFRSGTHAQVFGAYKGGVAAYIDPTPAWQTAPALGTAAGSTSYSLQLSATSAAGSCYYGLISDTTALPPGLSVSFSGLLSGTLQNPASDTTYTFTVRAYYDNTHYADRTFTMTVTHAANADPYSAQVLFLYHADGNYADASSYARTLTVTNPGTYSQVATTNPKFGTGSFYFGGTNQPSNADIRVPAAAALGVTGDFTMEWWMATQGTPPGNSVAFVSAAGAPGSTVSTEPANVVSIYAQSNNTSNHIAVKFTPSGTPIIGSTTNVNDGTWRHIAIVRSGMGTGNITIYVNGTAEATGTYTGTADFGTTYGFRFGKWVGENSTTYYSGYLDEIRLTTAARYTANFSPSTQAFPYP